jgi:asparagine synthase (glutamine-hydrolysing)
MCGILGVFDTNSSDKLEKTFNESLDLLKHRGPDDSGIKIFNISDGILVIGQTRLSIIDLSSAGHQPMQTEDNRYSIVFNGEIYNYKEIREELKLEGYVFKTNSDTEVLLNAWIEWGVEGLIKFNGMFAFAVYDALENSVTLVRDAFGIKPLFYSLQDNKLYFSSEISALINLLPEKPNHNLQRVYDYLVWGKYDNNEQTFYDKIFHLQPSHFLTIRLKDFAQGDTIALPKRWWWPLIKEQVISIEDAAKKIREIFLKNIKLQLRSDVPIGAALSGGVDSSSIVCAIRYLEPDMLIHTFSFLANDPDLNEEEWIDIINDHVDAIPHKVKVKSDDIINDLDEMIKAQAEPFGSTSIYAQYKVFKAARDAGITVTLDGQGADELLAGYSGYPLERIKSLIDKKEYLGIIKFINKWSKWPGRSKKRMTLECISIIIPKNLITLGRKIIGDNPRPNWLNIKLLKSSDVNLLYPNMESKNSDSFGRKLSDKLRNVLTGDGLVSLLRHGDRNSMNWSIESRVPFLTIEMAEFVLSLPESYLLSNNGETKYIFREAMRGIVPDKILDRKDKIGFGTPELEWLIINKENIFELIKNSNEFHLINKEKSLLEIENIISGKKTFSPSAWRLINYFLWSSTN